MPEKQKKPMNFLEILIAERKARLKPVSQETETEPQGETEYTPVKVKIRRMETSARTKPLESPSVRWKRGLGGRRAGNPPPLKMSKQAKVTRFFGHKSPKAQDIRAKGGK